MPTYSISRIGSFEQCPMKYKFRYIDKVKPEIPTTIEAFLGSRVHDALQKLYREKGKCTVMPLEWLLRYYNWIWDKKWEDSILIVKVGKTQDDYRSEGERQLGVYYEAHEPFDEGEILGLETWERLALDGDDVAKKPEYLFHIRIDRLMNAGDGLYEVHDYKCGARMDTQEKLDEDRQLAMYSLWVREQYAACKDVRLVWHFTAHDKEMESWRTEEQLAELKAAILTQIKEIEAAKEFPANVTRLCDWCEYKTICPEWA
jgi:putative RecB family exonuclease